MKKTGIFLLLLVTCFTYAGWMRSFTGGHTGEPEFVPPSTQQSGDAAKGFDYLVNGNYLRSGIGVGYFLLLNGKDRHNYLKREGRAALIPYNFNLIKAPNGVPIVTPNCLQCHAQVFNDSLYVGLGNTDIDFTTIARNENPASQVTRQVMRTISPKQYAAAKAFIRSFLTIYPFLRTEVRGVNAADRLAILLVAHRDPQSLRWSDSARLQVPDEVIPTDVPAWWLLKKKNAMFYNGFGRGDFSKFLMLSNLLTVADSAEAREVSLHFTDVLAYIQSIQPPRYPLPVNTSMAAEGQAVFLKNCSKCHGTYGENGHYPNLLVPEPIIKTDSMLFKSNYQNPQFIDWFNKSWYATTDHPARLEPFNGYIAPPLDGVWITAPYLHNGSVPTLEAVLNSRLRPQYWKRDFKHPRYDYNKLGWQYESCAKPGGRKVYNTTLPGYGNGGHYFGDKLSNQERTALIEYLKTL